MIKLMLINLNKYAEDQAKAHGAESRLTRIMLTMGSDGVLIFENGSFSHFPVHDVPQSEIKSVIGAGDSFLGGFTYSLFHELDLATCVSNGQLCAETTLRSEKNVSPEINEALLLQKN